MIEKLETRGESAAQLISTLTQAQDQSSKAGKPRKSTHQVWDRPDVQLHSWKFNDWDYYGRKGLKLPTNARGLFTKDDDKIVLRGYDKFFNASEHGEVSSTNWSDIEANTTGPYDVTLKENGCIVFMAGLEDGTLVITSKHSTGPRGDETEGTGDSRDRNHSWVASRWVDIHLQKAGKTREQLAKRLLELNATAVGELCDDDFEEHVLAYPKDQSGIYLHGLNVNCPDFVTYNFDAVHEIASEFGFIPTQYVTKPTLQELRKFLAECAETGSWGDRQVEGFVVRCKRNASDFFFKYKFEEPYLMYRQWRELTKKALAQKPQTPLPAIKKHVQLTRGYLNYALPILRRDPALKEQYLKNHGIIALRQGFLDSQNLDQAQVLQAQKLEEQAMPAKLVLMTVSTIGCGKTTTSVAVQKLTGWGHVQSDDFQGNRKKLIERAVDELKTHDVVIVDRNNQSRKNREQIMDEFGRLADVDYVCLNFLPNGVSDEIKRVTEDRVTKRGDNHQSIREMPEGRVKGIMSMFYKQFEPVDKNKTPDSMFSHIIDLDAMAGSLANTKTILDSMRSLYRRLEVPTFSKQQIQTAVAEAIAYQPTIKPVIRKSLAPYYFGVKIAADEKKRLLDLINSLLAESKTPCRLWSGVDTEFLDELHVTLAHVSDKKVSAARGELFKKLKSDLPKELVKGARNRIPIELPGKTASVKVTDLMFNDRIMALQVDLDTPCANPTPHITVAKKPGVQAYESNQMLINGTSTRISCTDIEIPFQPVCVWMD